MYRSHDTITYNEDLTIFNITVGDALRRPLTGRFADQDVGYKRPFNPMSPEARSCCVLDLPQS